MAKTKTRRRPARARPAQAPKKRQETGRLPSWAYALGGALLIAALAGGAFLLGKDKAQSGSEGPAVAAGGLPNTSDYHSLLVAPGDPQHILLGTHAGLYESTDGGLNWNQVALEGQDAMNLARSEAEIVWTAGHNVLAKSSDGGRSWSDVRPDGLPSVDVHGFAVDPRDQTLWAAVAGEGLYRSTDGGASFELASDEIGGNVMALAVTPEGRLLAGDMQQGLLASENEGQDWRVAAPTAVMGLAINPDDPTVAIAAGAGILRSNDGGASWQQVLEIAEGAGPVAWSASDPDIGYVVGFDRTLYRTQDRGESWREVS
ncbi:MAG: WD40/YVTN/BNR-like repeat-containing protein [Gaiellaceae bacterium]